MGDGFAGGLRPESIRVLRYRDRLGELGMTEVARRGLGWRLWWSGPWLRTRLVTSAKPPDQAPTGAEREEAPDRCEVPPTHSGEPHRERSEALRSHSQVRCSRAGELTTMLDRLK